MDDFTGIVHNVFLELYTELNLESIELFQMNDEQYGHIVCALPEKKIQEQTIKQIRRAGGRAEVVTSEKEVAEILLPELTQK